MWRDRWQLCLALSLLESPNLSVSLNFHQFPELFCPVSNAGVNVKLAMSAAGGEQTFLMKVFPPKKNKQVERFCSEDAGIFQELQKAAEHCYWGKKMGSTELKLGNRKRIALRHSCRLGLSRVLGGAEGQP